MRQEDCFLSLHVQKPTKRREWPTQCQPQTMPCIYHSMLNLSNSHCPTLSAGTEVSSKIPVTNQDDFELLSQPEHGCFPLHGLPRSPPTSSRLASQTSLSVYRKYGVVNRPFFCILQI